MKEGLWCKKAGTGVVGQPSWGGSSAVSELVGSSQSGESVSLRNRGNTRGGVFFNTCSVVLTPTPMGHY